MQTKSAARLRNENDAFHLTKGTDIMNRKTYTIKNPRTQQTKDLSYGASVNPAAIFSFVRESYPGWVFTKA